MNKEEKELKEWSDRMLGDMKLEQPSMGFSNRVMDVIGTVSIDQCVFNYRPLIGKWSWLGIGAGFMALMVFLLTSGSTFGLEAAGHPLMESVLKKTAGWSSIDITLPEVSPIVFISVLAFTLLALIEIPLCKRFLDKRATQ